MSRTLWSGCLPFNLAPDLCTFTISLLHFAKETPLLQITITDSLISLVLLLPSTSPFLIMSSSRFSLPVLVQNLIPLLLRSKPNFNRFLLKIYMATYYLMSFISHTINHLLIYPMPSANFVNKGTSNQSGRSGGRSSSNFSSNRGRSNWNNQRGRGRGRPNFSNASNRPMCQVCHKIGHVALQCYHRFNNSYTMDNTPQMQALLATQQQVVDPNWYPDSGATHHLTHDLANLNVRADEYSGSEQI
jgi:hypothetical protein